ncbi:MAG: cell division protein ZapA [Gammaproteobacteria bacterium]|jgi:cell division protein ZapA
MSDPQPISVIILDKEYKVACPIGEQAALLASAKYLDGKMREVRENGSILGAERIAVISALNIANDYLSTSEAVKGISEELSPRLKNLEAKIARVIEQTKSLEN